MEQVYNQNFQTENPQHTPKKKKSKLPIILIIVAVAVVLVLVASVLFLGGKLSLASAYKGFNKQLEEKLNSGLYENAKLFEKYEHEGKLSAMLELAEIPETLAGDAATKSAIEGSKLELSLNRSSNDKKIMLDADATVAGMMEVGCDFYADEEVIQIKIPMLSEDTFELKNEDILGQLSKVIPALNLKGGKITFEKTDIDTLIKNFSEKYEERLKKANEKITVEQGEKAEHSAFGKENVNCDTFNISIPAEVINEYLACVEDYISNFEMFKMLGDSFSMETTEVGDGIELTVYTAKKGFFASNCIVGVDIDDIEDNGEDDKSDKLEVSFNGEKNIFDDITMASQGETLLTYKSERNGTLTQDNSVIMVDGSEVKITSSYDSKTGKFNGQVQSDAVGTEVKVSLEYIIKDEKGSLSADELTVTVDADGEQLVLEGNIEYSLYESPKKISESAKEFNLQNILSIIGSLYGDLGGLAM